MRENQLAELNAKPATEIMQTEMNDMRGVMYGYSYIRVQHRLAIERYIKLKIYLQFLQFPSFIQIKFPHCKYARV